MRSSTGIGSGAIGYDWVLRAELLLVVFVVSTLTGMEVAPGGGRTSNANGCNSRGQDPATGARSGSAQVRGHEFSWPSECATFEVPHNGGSGSHRRRVDDEAPGTRPR